MWSPVESSVQIPIHKLRKISASSRHTRPKTYENLEKIEPQTSQIEARGPPKLRPEPSKALCYKDTNLRRFKSRLLYARRRHFEPTWLQVGGPRASKIEAKIRKNRYWKTTCFRDRFLGRPGMVFNRFLDGFLDPKSMQKAT